MTDDEATEVAALVGRAAAGDRTAWTSLVERFGRLVFAVCRSFGLSQDDSADVSQTVWLKLSERLDTLRQPERVGAWLVTTTKRECLALLRVKSRVELTEDDDRVAPDDPAADAVRAEAAVEVTAAFALISPRCQALLRILLIDGTKSYQEVSESLGIPVGAIGPTRGRCLTQLRRQLEGIGGLS